jgi:hypothetical protein
MSNSGPYPVDVDVVVDVNVVVNVGGCSMRSGMLNKNPNTSAGFQIGEKGYESCYGN